MTITEYIIDTVGLNPARESPLLFPGDRWNWLPDLCNRFGLTTGAEIGVDGGRFSSRLCRTVDGLTLYAVDPWENERAYRKAAERLLSFENCHMIRDTSVNAAAQFASSSLDFVYLDADRRYESVSIDLLLWSDKVRAGGVICGCCYYNVGGERVQDAVNDWTWTHGIKPWFVLVHHRYPCYLWVKP